MTDTDPDPIFLYRVDLGVSQDRSFTANLGSSSAITSSFKPARFLSEVPFLQHWTLQVRGICYEVTEKDPDPNRLRDDKPGHGLYILPMREWHRRRRAKGLRCRKDILGATNWSDEKIRSLGMLIDLFEAYLALTGSASNQYLVSTLRATVEFKAPKLPELRGNPSRSHYLERKRKKESPESSAETLDKQTDDFDGAKNNGQVTSANCSRCFQCHFCR